MEIKCKKKQGVRKYQGKDFKTYACLVGGKNREEWIQIRDLKSFKELQV